MLPYATTFATDPRLILVVIFCDPANTADSIFCLFFLWLLRGNFFLFGGSLLAATLLRRFCRLVEKIERLCMLSFGRSDRAPWFVYSVIH
jgi:hypothetical protein